MTAVDVRLIGAMQLRVDGEPVRLPGAAERGLLALLLLAGGRTVSATSLIDRLWSEAAQPADPVNALQVRVSKLRRALSAYGVDAIVREPSGYRADVDPEAVDVHRFVARVTAARAETRAGRTGLALYDEALALWRGDPLADFAGEGWATVEAARLQQLRRAALTERSEAALAVGRHADVAADLEPVVAEDPKQEALAGLLMTALYRSGRQADALEVFARTRRCLDEELGLQPSAALRALHQRVLQQDLDLAAVPAAPAPVVTVPAARRAQEEPRPSPSLPLAALRLIGRDAEVDGVADLLSRERVVTLVGPGGAGKTSLALAVAHGVADRFRHGVRVVGLATVTESSQVPLAVADAVGVPLDGADPTGHVRDRLLAYLANRELLLVLDNCEHVVDAAAGLVDAVLTGVAGVTVLATSREALAVPGEMQVSVAPLDVPPAGTAPERVLDYPAARLFVERARAVRSGLAVTDDDLEALTVVCSQLDGMPLALELAAARMASLSLPELAERLVDRFRLLTTGPRTAVARQRTLRATVEWSHALLPPAERVAFRRLAVFHGGWTLAAAEAVVAGGDIGSGDVLDLLGHLVSRSMVVSDPGHPTRYRMLETLREYAAEELAQSGELDDVAGRHAAFYRGYAEDADAAVRGHGQRAALQQLRVEQPNLRAALTWLSAHPSRVDDALRLAGALGLFWHLGRHLEGREVLRRVVALPGGSVEARARALQGVSIVERPRGCLVHPSPRCGETAQASLDLFLQAGDLQRAALSRVLLAVESIGGADDERLASLLAAAEAQFTADGDAWGHAVVAFVRLQDYLERGDEARALATGRAAAEAFRALDDAWGLSAVLYHLGWGLKEFGRDAEAVPVLEQAIESATSADLFNTAQWALADLGFALLHLGERDAAAGCFDRAVAASREIGDAAGEVLAAFGRATLAQADGDARAARPLFGEALRGLQRMGTPLWEGHARAGLAWCDWRDGLLDEAAGGYRQVHDTGTRVAAPTLVAAGLEGLARVAAARGDLVTAARHLEDAAGIRRAAARPRARHEQAELDALVGLLPSG